jgi:hypothetical protein
MKTAVTIQAAAAIFDPPVDGKGWGMAAAGGAVAACCVFMFSLLAIGLRADVCYSAGYATEAKFPNNSLGL